MERGGKKADITFRAVCLLTDSEEEVGQALTGVLEWNPRRGVRILQLQQESLAGFERKRREKESDTRA